MLVWHHDEDQAIGVVVNRPLQHTLPEVLDLDEQVDLAHYDRTFVGWGGPVDTAVGTVITPSAVVEDIEGWNLACGIAVTRSQDTLVRLLRRQAPMLLCLGYAGWGAGQLDREIQEGSWLWTDCDRALLFDVPAEERYDRALATLGLTQTTVWMQPIDE